MDFETLISERYSVRSFRPEHLPQSVIEKILQAGHKAPTALLVMGYPSAEAKPIALHFQNRPIEETLRYEQF